MLFGNKKDSIAKAVAKGKEAGVLKYINDKDMEVRLAAIAAIGKVGKDDGFNAMVPLLHDANPTLRAAAAAAIGEIGNVHGKAHLSRQLQNETDEKVKEALKAAMAKIANY